MSKTTPRIGDEVYVHGYIDEIRKDIIIIRNEGGYFGTVFNEIIVDRKTELMKTADYCDICKRDMCEGCVADAINPYCVPSHYEIQHEPKTEHSGGVTEMVETMSCEECGHWEHGAGDHYYCALLEMGQECYFEPKGESTLMFANEPQIEKSR